MFYVETVRGDVPRLHYLTQTGGWSTSWERRARYHTLTHALRAVDLYAGRAEKQNAGRHLFIQDEQATRAGGVSVITALAMMRAEGRSVGAGYIGRFVRNAQARALRPITAGSLRNA